MPDGDEWEFCDRSDTIQEMHGANADEARNIGDPPGEPGTPEVPDGDDPHQAADKGARPTDPARYGSC